ncbi:hypothetical protein D0Y65_000588 [Glycine soja]|uniref:Serine aminopeptidase S33 domain-containing protein n=1 Tax=Glycine soja TaxID=3848 RepID=A0A445LZD8_GLYSO|nr:hypothetical protein D0Y65_000588 [Glycine soja]RZC28681.1 hypothetical protein D0Y65_000588 [Glycine soja]
MNMFFSLSIGSSAALPLRCTSKLTSFRVVADADGFPSFLPREIHNIQDPFARKFALRIQRLPVPVRFSENPIMSSCVKPLVQTKETPVVLLHGFDSSCLEWRYVLPLLEESGIETWAIDILGWGFSDLEKLPPCDVVSKRDHFYQISSTLRIEPDNVGLYNTPPCLPEQFWKSYIRRPMILVGPSLGSAVAIDFAVNYPEAVKKLVLIGASVYAEGTGKLATLPRAVAYAGVNLLKSLPLRLYATYLTFTKISFSTSLDWTNVSCLILELLFYYVTQCTYFFMHFLLQSGPFGTCTLGYLHMTWSSTLYKVGCRMAENSNNYYHDTCHC